MNDPVAWSTFSPSQIEDLRSALDAFLFRHEGNVERQDGIDRLDTGRVEITRGPDPEGRSAYTIAVDGAAQLRMTVVEGKLGLRLDHGSPGPWLTALALAALSSVDHVIRQEEEGNARRASLAKARADARLSANQIGLRLLAMVHTCGWLAPGSKDVLVHAVGRWVVTATRDRRHPRVTVTVTDGPAGLMRLTATAGSGEWDIDVTNRARGAWAAELLSACPLRVGPPPCDSSLSWWPQRSRRRVARQALAGFRWTLSQDDIGS